MRKIAVQKRMMGTEDIVLNFYYIDTVTKLGEEVAYFQEENWECCHQASYHIAKHNLLN